MRMLSHRGQGKLLLHVALAFPVGLVQVRVQHLGVEKIIVQPEADGGWSFSGVGDLTRLVGGRKGAAGSGAAPPD